MCPKTALRPHTHEINNISAVQQLDELMCADTLSLVNLLVFHWATAWFEVLFPKMERSVHQLHTRLFFSLMGAQE